MILRRLRLHPFAGLADREIGFEPGLNVVLGPNEAGKSTLRRALRQALLVTTSLTQREAREEVMPFLPLGGGDTLRVSLEFESGGGLWRLEKRWAKGNSGASLFPPDGGELSDPGAVEKRLGELLGLTRGTWDHVLFSAQGEVASSLDRLDGGDDLAELNERLRRALFETDGVSLEALDAALAKRLEESFGRWDRERGRPEGNRGLSNPWSRGAGGIVSAWYARERARAALEEAEGYYRRLDEVNVRLAAAASAHESVHAWISGREAAANDADRRGALEGRLAGIAERAKTLRQISQAWPVCESRAKDLEEQAVKLGERTRLLGEELAKAKAWEAAAQGRRRLEGAEKLAAETEAARASLAELGAFDPGALAELERIERERDRLKARLEAASLRVRFAAARPIRVETRAGVEEPVARDFDAPGEAVFVAGGRVSIREGEGAWELEVASGGIDPAAEEAGHRQLGETAVRLLAALGVDGLEAARAKAAAVRERSQRLALIEGQLGELLAGQSLAELREENRRDGGGGDPARSLADIAGEAARSRSEEETSRRELEAQRRQLADYAREYGGQDDILDRLVSLRGQERQLAEELAGLAPLPEGCTDAAAFLREFRARREERERLRSELGRLQVEKAELAGAAPEIEPAEAAEALAAAESAFVCARREGEALDRIRCDFDALRDELDADTLGPWRRHLGEILAPLTSGRYLGLAEGEGLSAARRADKLEIPFSALSAGARASFGLAVRLSMARWFLEGRSGFLLLDDPLVDLDPSRQDAAAAMLGRFGEDKQVVVFTCHPGHAERLGGRLVEL